MLGKRIINTGADAGAACTTDTVQILDGTPFDSIATYELESDASNSIKSGYIGNGAIFNGSSSYVDTGISSLSGAFSVSLWINEISLASGSMFGNWNSTSANDIYIDTNSSGQLILGIDGISNQTFGSSGDISVNTWHHIVMTFNNGTVEAYLDGDSLGTSTTSNTSFSSGLNFVIGASSTKSNASHFNGTIDEVRIYNTALTAGNVATLYAETASSTISISGLQAHYKFEGDATDETGNYDGTASNITYNEYDGTATNVTYATGKFGNAAVFNGSSSEIVVSTISNIKSYSFWIKAGVIGNNYGRRIFGLDSSGYTDCVTYIGNATSKVGVVDGSGNIFYSDTVSDNNWHHIAITTNGNSLKIYTDGTLSSTNTTTYFTSSFTHIGSNNTNRQFDGSLDQLRIYDKVLSAANVSTLYAETLATSQTNTSLNAPSGVAYYKMNDATDETGSYDGTATNVNFNVAGKFGNAGEFNGSSKIDTGIDLDTYDETWSISLWVKFTFNSSYRYIAGDLSVTTALNGFTIDTSTTGQIRFRFRNSSGSVATITSPNTYGDGNWHHITGVKGSSNNYLYIDGSQVGSVATVNGISHSTNLILGQVGAFNGFYLGSIDQVRIFDRAITSDEVTTLYDEVYCQPTIVPTDHFEPVIYTGNGTTQSISSLDFQPDFTWIKERNNPIDHLLFDVVRGAGVYQRSNLASNDPAPQLATLSSFDSNGFSVGTDGGVNGNNDTYVAWNWKAGGTAVSANSIEATNATRSANVDAGFSIIKFQTSDSTASPPPMNYIEHGLDATPEMVIYKRTNSSQNWVVQNSYIQQGQSLALNLTNAVGTNNATGFFDNTSTSIGVRSNFAISRDQPYIAYAFHSVEGMSKIGSYTGTGASGISIVTGFRPAFLLIKNTDSAHDWVIFDNKRDTTNPNSSKLSPNTSGAEYTNSSIDIDFASNGFVIQGTDDAINDTNETHIYLAIAEENTQPEPELANSFNVVTYTGNGSTQAVTGLGFQPDMVWIKERTSTSSHRIVDSVRGDKKRIYTNVTNAESEVAAGEVLLDNGFQVGADNGSNQNGEDYVAWAWKASNDSTINNDGSITSIVSANPAAGFSVVKWVGSGSQPQTVGHGLSSAPELVIYKNTDTSSNWHVYHESVMNAGDAKFLRLNTNNSLLTDGGDDVWTSGFSSTTFGIGNANNASGNDHIAYCFNSVDGYQKIGSYSGDGTSNASNIQNIGFRPRFLLIKSSNVANNWEIFDSTRDSINPNNKTLAANLSNAETTYTYGMNFLDNGFVPENSWFNGASENFIYLAIA